MDVKTFADVQEAMRMNSGRAFHLLLGNGFSMSYAPNIFSYNALHGFITRIGNPLLQALFRVVDTHDFERVMQQLETFAAIGAVLGIDDPLRRRIEEASAELKKSLIDAIRALHPEHVFTIPEKKCAVCTAFLRQFLDTKGSLFTTNYDLLLYWILMRGGLPSVDGFGRDRESPDEYVPPDELEYSELRWGRNRKGQNVHYVHGALPLFDTGVEIVKEEYSSEAYLLEQVTKRVQSGDYPVFVTAGNGKQKLTHIRHNPYLQNSYEALASVTGSLVTFGFNFGEQDDHIVSAIQRATRGGRGVPRLWSVYIGAYSEHDVDRAEEVGRQLKCKVHIFDSKTANAWG